MTDPDARLDALIARARTAEVAPIEAERYVRKLEAQRPEPRPQRHRLVPWFAAAMASAAVVGAALWLWPRPGPTEPVAAVAIDERVAIVAEAGASYRVLEASAAATRIAVDRGAITARLWHGAAAHRLTLEAAGVSATATGTVYSLAVRPSGVAVGVVEGSVEVRTGDAVHRLSARETWPPGAAAADPASGHALLALAKAPRVAGEPLAVGAARNAGARVPGDTEAPDASNAAPEAAPEADARSGSADNATSAAPAAGVQSGSAADASGATPTAGAGSGSSAHVGIAAHVATAAHAEQRPPPAAPSIKDRWHTARLLRSQGNLAAARAECLTIADAGDPTWSPIALVEAVRIELGPLAEPEQAIALAERMIHAWPDNSLVGEARELRCRALHQLGRDCTPAPP